MKWWILLALSLAFFGGGPSAFARLYLNASIYDKKGIDLGLNLASELHVLEEVRKGQEIVLQMRAGIEVRLKAHFQEDVGEGSYGPSDMVLVVGEIRDTKGQVLESFLERPIAIRLGEQEVVVYNHKAQLIELKLGFEVL